MNKKRTYNLPLLIIGLIAIIFIVSSYTLRNYYTIAILTANSKLDIIFGLVFSFIIIMQPKEGVKFSLISLLTYGIINLISALFYASSMEYYYNNLSLVSNNRAYYIASSLGLLLANITFLIGILFIGMHVIQPRFSLKISKILIGSLFAASFVFLLIPGILLTASNVSAAITLVVFLISHAIILVASVMMITDKEPQQMQSSYSELDKLRKNGLITEDEYQHRKEKIEQKKNSN